MPASSSPKTELAKNRGRLLLQEIPTRSVTNGTRVVFKFDKVKGWVLETYGTKESVRRVLDDSDKKKRDLARKEYSFKWWVKKEVISDIIRTLIKSLKGY